MATLRELTRTFVGVGGGESVMIARVNNEYTCSCATFERQRKQGEARPCRHIEAFWRKPAAKLTSLESVPDYEEAPDVRASRHAKVDAMIERHVVLADRFEEVTGLRLPKQLAYAVGFFSALSPEEREVITDGPGLLGVARWFEGSADEPRGPEVRVQDRLPNDPPPFFPILSERGHGRYGLYYDDTSQLPTGTAVREGADSRLSPTRLLEPTPLRAIYSHLRWKKDTSHPAWACVLSWLSAVAEREVEAERSPVEPTRGQTTVTNDALPFIEGWTIPKELVTERAQRHIAHAEGRSTYPPLIERALQEVKDGRPGTALVLGLELYDLDDPKLRLQTSELLIRAYLTLRWRALADVVVDHYRARGESVFEIPQGQAVVGAAHAGDVEEVRRALAQQSPSAEAIREGMLAASSPEILETLLAADASQSDNALCKRLDELASAKPPPVARRLAKMLLERGAVSARAFRRLLSTADDELIAIGARRVELVETTPEPDHEGATALHFAAGAARPDLLRQLLDRGADPHATDRAGKKAFDYARVAWRAHPHEAGEVFEILEGMGAGERPPAKVEPPPEWSVGDKVEHTKFGRGVVAEIHGLGEETKLGIRFGKKDHKTLLAKFVRKVSA